MADHLLALDAGTSGARCAIVRPGRAAPVVSVREPWSYVASQDGNPLARSFDPAKFWSVLRRVCKRAFRESGLAGGDIAAVGVTSQRLGIVVIDKQGEAVHAGPNVDARAFLEGLAIDRTMAERVYASGGKLPSLLLAPARLHWMRQHDRRAYKRAASVLSIGDWVAFRLTGERRNERSLAADCGLLNVTTRERDEGLLDELEVSPALLPPLVSSTEIAGEVSQAAARATGLARGTPVVIAGGDTQCALAAMGIDSPGDVGIAAGWSAPLAQVVAEPRIDAQRRTWTDLHAIEGRWLVDSSPADIGRMWEWWCETLLGPGDGVLDRAAKLVGKAPDTTGDVVALLGPGVMNAGSMSMHLGGVIMTTPLQVGIVSKQQMLRVALENIAFALRGNLEQAQEVSGLPAGRVAAGGGFTRLPAFARVLTDVLARPLDVAREIDVTARGAALIAGRAAGIDAARAARTRALEPRRDASEAYEPRYQRWLALGPALDRVMQELA